ncbi:MAG: HipA domain-containing protein [Acidimicrobiales bacterium]
MELGVWLDGTCVAVLSERRKRMSMAYTADAGAAGIPLVSVSMPVGSGRFGDDVARAFFCGLLPEGEARGMIAYDFGLDLFDDMGLLAALGRDCAGALQVLPAGEAPEQSQTGLVDGATIDDAEIGRRLERLPVQPLGVDGNIRVSLAGMQPKLLLCRGAEGRWSLPSSGSASTHILKPAHGYFPSSVANEAFCMTLAAAAGLPAAATTQGDFGGIEVLVSKRYDRRISGGGSVARVHQEDACQALSMLTLAPERKYEGLGGPSLAQVAALLDRWSGAVAKGALLAQVAFNCLVGNADAHGKNVSLMHNRDGTISLAPLYDVMSTVYCTTTGLRMNPTLGLFVNGQRHVDEVTVGDLMAEAERWGVRLGRASLVLSELLERLPDAVERAADEVASVPGGLVDLVTCRVDKARQQMAIAGRGTAPQGYRLLRD